MTRLISLAFLSILIFAPAAYGTQTPGAASSIDIEPCAAHIGDVGGMARQACNDQGYGPIDYLSQDTKGTSRPTTVNALVYADKLDNGVGVFFVGSHGFQDGIAVEVYDHTPAGHDGAELSIDTYVLNGDFDYDDLDIGEDPHQEVWVVYMKPAKHGQLFSGTADGLVGVLACSCYPWAGTGWPGAHCVLSFNRTILVSDAYVQFSSVFARLDGWNGKDKRLLTNAFDAAPDIQKTGTTDLVLAPSIVSMFPYPGMNIGTDTDGYIEFDCYMETNTDADRCIVVGAKATTRDARWTSSNRIDFTISPYGTAASEIYTTDRCVSMWGNVEVDGNTDPPGSDGYGPNRDRYLVAFDATAPEGPNTAASFEGAWAFPDRDGIHILWVTDPERGSTSFDVWAGTERQQLVTTVPAQGGALPHYYEVVTQIVADHYEVVEHDANPMTPDDGTRPFKRSSGPPGNLAELRNLNAVVATWPPTPITPIEYNRSQDPGGEDPLTISVADFAFYCGNSDIYWAAMPAIDWLYDHGWTVHGHIGPPNANDAKYHFRIMYEYAVEHHAPRVPTCVILGEANEGDHPERNIVGTFYVPDADGQCYWNSCASDLEMTNFYGNGPEAPYTRVNANSVAEMNNCVNSTLEYYNGTHAQNAWVEALAGDLTGTCSVYNRPRLLMDEVCTWYANRGIPYTKRVESSWSCYDYSGKLTTFAGDMNVGRTELIGVGPVTNRSIMPGWFFQKISDPVFTMAYLPRLQRLVVEFPGCGMGDTDRNNPSYYPSIPKMMEVNNPASGTSAVCWLAHSRGGEWPLHEILAREYFDERVNNLHHLTVQETYWTVVRRLWDTQPAMRPYLQLAMAYGFPVQLPGYLNPASAAEELPRRFDVHLTNAPNPGRETTVRYDLPGLARLQLSIVDVSGRLVRTLVSPNVVSMPGSHTITWDGRTDNGLRAAGGVYFIRLEVDGTTAASRKLVLLK